MVEEEKTDNLWATTLTGILDDSYALCMARKESLTSLINLMGAYREEDDYTVVSNLLTVMLSSQYCSLVT